MQEIQQVGDPYDTCKCCLARPNLRKVSSELAKVKNRSDRYSQK
jgi:hypothetical protein